MLIIIIYRFILGYVKIRITGEFSERFLNLCVLYSVTVWNIKKTKEDITLYMYAKDFLKIRTVRGKSAVSIKILKKHGLPFYLSKYKKRTGVFIGLIIFFVLLKLLSLFVWSIDVCGNNKITDDEILSVCTELGIKQGMRSDTLDTRNMREELLLKIDGLAWAAINIEGSIVSVNVTERTEESERLPCNVIAEDDGVILSFFAHAGTSELKIGQGVKAGDLLISGTEVTGNITRFVRAKGEVLAEVTKDITVTEKYLQTQNILNGKRKSKTVLEFFGIKIPLYIGGFGDNYIDYSKTKRLSFLGEKIPIYLHTRFAEYYFEKPIIYDREQIINRLRNDVDKLISEQNIENYTVISREIAENVDEVTMTVKIKHIKNIAKQENFIIPI